MKKQHQILLRVAGWFLLLWWLWPANLFLRWESLLIALAAVELVPWCLVLLRQTVPGWFPLLSIPFALTLTLDGPWWLVLPYLGAAIGYTWRSFVAHLSQPQRPLSGWVQIFALGYWATAALWALMHMVHFQPFGFDPVIVTLTAAHFHLAGLVLSTLVFANLMLHNRPITRWLGMLSLAGMPLVALGITLTRLGYAPIIEQGAALFFIGYALLFIWHQTSMAFQANLPARVRTGWLLGAGSLVAGMLLATLYALRFQIPLEWINIPNLKYWHGTLNTLGFGFCSLLGWVNIISQDNKS
ncbi:MAG TPA: YndJ family transporter [Saprospiraceae bacterium]|nr:YndJ family transporter [Saprospiraceae bacterium]